MSVIGACGGCGGPLGAESLHLGLDAGPGPRGGNRTAVIGTRLDRFDLCGPCVAGEIAAGTALAKMLTDEYAHSVQQAQVTKCTVTCLRPRRRTMIMLGRRRLEEFENAYCPVCYGPAEVTAAPGAAPVTMRLRDRIRRRMPLRETWNVKELGSE